MVRIQVHFLLFIKVLFTAFHAYFGSSVTVAGMTGYIMYPYFLRAKQEAQPQPASFVGVSPYIWFGFNCLERANIV